jgi:hypothetical protein
MSTANVDQRHVQKSSSTLAVGINLDILAGDIERSLLGLVDPSFRALSGRLKFTARRDKFDYEFL